VTARVSPADAERMSIPPPSFPQEVLPQSAALSSGPPSYPPGLGGSSHGEYSGWWLRVAAVVLDGLLIGVPLLVLSVILIVAGLGRSPGATLLRLLLGLVLATAYYLGTMTRPGIRNGQTLGKQLVGIRVGRDDGCSVSAATVLRREVLIKGLLTWVTLGVFELLDCLWPLGDASNRALHDRIVRTHVLRDPTRRLTGRAVFGIVAAGFGVWLLVGLVLAVAIPTFLSRKPASAQENAAQVQTLEQDMGVAFAVERAAAQRNQPPALDTGTLLVGHIAAGEPGLGGLLSTDADPGHGDAKTGLIYLGGTTPTAFEAVAYTADGTRVACEVTNDTAGCTANGG
jgi:uncharacterized RDD family membrane protein YckC